MFVILIPAYQPDEKLIRLAESLRKRTDAPIQIVDDGSQPSCASLFSKLEVLGCEVVHHEVNLGKGAAIKTGIKTVFERWPNADGVVTCDADGQHEVEDILRVSEQLALHPDSLIMGVRDFSQPDVPKQSRFGNRFSSLYFRLNTGMKLEDTQTGLRGIGKELNELALSIPENRYDYEMNFLMRVAKEIGKIETVKIRTVYLENNASSHFRPVMDSIRIYKEPLKFAAASLTCAAVDLGVFTLLSTLVFSSLLQGVAIATIVARILSGILNFVLNRVWSFRSFSSIFKQFRRYFVLYIAQLLLSITFVTLLAFLPIHLTVIKLFVDGLLFLGSFFIQKNWVYRHS